MVEIGKVAGVSHGLVTYHFGNKKECIKSVLEALQSETALRIDKELSDQRGLSNLDRICEHYLRLPTIGDYPGIRAIYVAIAESISATPELKELVASNDMVFRDAVTRVLIEAVEDEEISSVVNIDTHAVLVVGLLRGIRLQQIVDDSAVELGSVTSMAIAMVRESLPQVS